MMNKQYLLLISVFLFIPHLQYGQDFRIGIEGGYGSNNIIMSNGSNSNFIGLSNIHDQHYAHKEEAIGGHHFGLNVEFLFNEIASLNSGLRLMNKGYRFTNNDGEPETGESQELSYLVIPLTGRYRAQLGNSNLTPFGELGLYYGMLQGAEVTVNSGVKVPFEEFYNDQDFGVIVGLGLELELDGPLSISPEIGYESGISDVFSDEADVDAPHPFRNETFLGRVTIQYAFNQ